MKTYVHVGIRHNSHEASGLLVRTESVVGVVLSIEDLGEGWVKAAVVNIVIVGINCDNMKGHVEEDSWSLSNRREVITSNADSISRLIEEGTIETKEKLQREYSIRGFSVQEVQ